MTPQPSVSVVVPTRDRPELLRAAVRAILSQDYPGPVEVVVVFDQSAPDESLTGLGSGPDRAVRVIRNVRTQGLAGARNSGTLAAQGELVAFCDDDDEWLPGKLAAQVDALAADLGGEFVCCGIRVSYDGSTVDRVLDKERITLDDLLRDRMTGAAPVDLPDPRQRAARRVRSGRRGDPGQLRGGLRVPAPGRAQRAVDQPADAVGAGPLAQAVVLRAALGHHFRGPAVAAAALPGVRHPTGRCGPRRRADRVRPGRLR